MLIVVQIISFILPTCNWTDFIFKNFLSEIESASIKMFSITVMYNGWVEEIF